MLSSGSSSDVKIPALEEDDSDEETTTRTLDRSNLFVFYFARATEMNKIISKYDLDTTKNEPYADFILTPMILNNGQKCYLTTGTNQGIEFNYKFIQFIKDVDPTHVIMVGVCSSCHKDVLVNDVIISNHSKLMIGRMPTSDLMDLKMNDVIEKDVLHEGQISNIKTDKRYHIGGILQSPFVLAFDYSHLITKLSTGDRDIMAIDMESWSFMNICKMLKGRVYPVVKGVMDKGANKTDEHYESSCDNAFIVAQEVMKIYIDLGSKKGVKRTMSTLSEVTTRKKQKRARMLKINEIKELQMDDDDKALIIQSLKIEDYADLGIKRLEAIERLLKRPTVKLLKDKIYN